LEGNKKLDIGGIKSFAEKQASQTYENEVVVN